MGTVSAAGLRSRGSATLPNEGAEATPMPGNSNLHDSSRNKQDEFYTNLQLIEDELRHYRTHFKGMRVLCN